MARTHAAIRDGRSLGTQGRGGFPTCPYRCGDGYDQRDDGGADHRRNGTLCVSARAAGGLPSHSYHPLPGREKLQIPYRQHLPV